MKSVNATITSKNQLTLPAKLVRKYKMDINRAVTITDKNGVIEIRPERPLEEVMAPIWKEMREQIKRPLSDEELNQAIRDSFAARWDQLRKEGRV